LALLSLLGRQAVDHLAVTDHGDLCARIVDLLEDLLADGHEHLPGVGADAFLFR